METLFDPAEFAPASVEEFPLEFIEAVARSSARRTRPTITGPPSENGTARLWRDGALIGEVDSPSFASFPVPPDAGDYRLEVQSIRDSIFGLTAALSTQIDLAWSFRSDADEPGALPVAAVTFAPALDERNSAPAGRPFEIPLALSRQPGAPAAPLRRLGVKASYDRGQTWQRALVVRFGDIGLALIHHPRASHAAPRRQRLPGLRAPSAHSGHWLDAHDGVSRLAP